MQNINITNTRVVNATQVTNVYDRVVINRNVARVNYTYATNARAVTVVQRDTFVNARPVSQGMLRVNAQQIAGARVVDSAPIAPTRTSYISAGARVSTARPAVPISRRAVVVRLNPAVANPNRGGRAYTNDSRQFNQPSVPRGAAPKAQPAAVNNNQPQQPSRDGFRPFQPPAGTTRNQAPVERNQNQGAQPNNRENQNNNQQQHQNINERQQPNNRANENQNQQNEQRTFRYAPPAQAHDNMYDVH
ncbi:MAG: hypothetical protein ACREPS_11515, partial [Rhodanobacteraceae bacterium]